ncbi:tRNA lysidine(34) synthetase TilS [Dactylosporangium aurantiacum]|uniref:tRNA(Ile)-lysidine synthase n=1 Tax=Dactylosporangium aurantiacum TaxID=35754 RepID=A0A9Q9IKU2_9ACTN|nr:tRNA lysidine(34) synthetase TilS [Dactylosporangium aurantiacum]MDG6100727.1 tRNA lysidine(34) synthetase TilS [Dactylosporangium aurantiacum]UWZ55204.1 tRNA lysidine(34) synthetase TilS [Dactylosporangium aurantiacum]
MAALAPAVAAVRAAVRRGLADMSPGDTVLVACSGGADSLALAVAARFVTQRMRTHCGLVTVDHGLQAGSGERAARLAGWAREHEFDPVDVRTVKVAGHGGPEASARNARYAALVAAAKAHRAALVLLGHTRDDQAETVLLALTRGAGPHGLAGMPARRERQGVCFARPLLDVTRADTRAACEVAGLTPWEDPHNSDHAYARSRVRPLVAALGPAVIDNLARTAALVAADTALLDELAADAYDKAATGADELDVAELQRLPQAVRTRVLHAWARRLGVSGGALSHRHVVAMDNLVTDWHGQGPAALPGGLRVARQDGRLRRLG